MPCSVNRGSHEDRLYAPEYPHTNLSVTSGMWKVLKVLEIVLEP